MSFPREEEGEYYIGLPPDCRLCELNSGALEWGWGWGWRV